MNVTFAFDRWVSIVIAQCNINMFVFLLSSMVYGRCMYGCLSFSGLAQVNGNNSVWDVTVSALDYGYLCIESYSPACHARAKGTHVIAVSRPAFALDWRDL